jgi:hypothetical protein
VLLGDLNNNNNNIWAMTGLHTAYLQQGKTKDATTLQQQLKKVSNNADVKITAPVL